MAIKTEHPYINEVGEADDTRVRTYSDEGKLIIKLSTGEEYQEAIDLYPCPFTYVEKPDEDEVNYKEDEDDIGRSLT